MGDLDDEARTLRARIARWVLAIFRNSPAKKQNAFCAWLGVDDSVLTNIIKAETKGELDKATASVDLLYKLLTVTGTNINRVLLDDVTKKDEEDMESRLRSAWEEYRRDAARKNVAG